MDIKSKIDEISQSIKEIGVKETAKKYREITVGGLFVLLLLTFLIFPRGEVTSPLGEDGCQNFKLVIMSYNSLPEEARTKEMKDEVEKAEKIVKKQCE